MSTGIYIHIPYCHSKCIYCDFYSTPARSDLDKVVAAIADEYELRKDELTEPVSTIYLGGGTPSIVPPDILHELMTRLPVAEAGEITIEVNPEDVKPESAAAWQSMGFNRVSMGVQSLDDTLLHWMRRRHDATTALKAIGTLRDAGIDNISCDLIYGLPRLTDGIWRDTLERLLDTGITHLSAYCLSYQEGTALQIRLDRGLDPQATDDDIVSQYDILCQSAAAHGFEHYEISNFARPGFRSRHNSLYWSPAGRWLGLGPSAHSFDGTIRRIDIADTGRWLAAMPRPYDIDDETDIDRLNDTIVTSLRTLEGLDIASLTPSVSSDIIRDAEPHIRAGYMTLQDGRLAIAEKHWLISDTFIRDLIRMAD